MDRVSYRQLQAFAKVMKLPGNMKYQVLWELVHARKSGNERLVSQLLAEQNRIRVKRRISRKAAKMEAEALGRLIRQETANVALSYDMNQDRSSLSPPPHDAQVLSAQTKICVAALLDLQLRCNMMLNEGRFCRNAALELPIPTIPVYNQVESIAKRGAVAQRRLLTTVLECPWRNSNDNVSHIEVIATDFRSKPTQFKFSEPKKPSFQIEDIISSAPPTTYASAYSNNYQMSYNGYVECTPNGMGTFVSQPVNVSQDSVQDPWRKHYSDLISEPHSVSSNGSHSSLFIDTSRLSPMSSGTLSANEICEDPAASDYQSTGETIEEVSLQPSYQTLASAFLPPLETPVLSDADTRGQYSHVVEEITYQETEPPHNLTAVVFSKSDPLELKNCGDELSVEDSKIFDGLKNLHNSLGINIATNSLPADEDRAECDSSNVEAVDRSDAPPQEAKIERNSSPTSPELVS